MNRSLLLFVSVLALAACTGRSAVLDAGSSDSSAPHDAVTDAPALDAALTDAAAVDAGHDAGVLDASRDAAPPVDGASCSIVGDYAITFMGMTAYFRFAADGTWSGNTTRAGLDTPTGHGMYTFTGGTMRLTENDGSASCMPTDMGSYTVTFDAGCTGLALALISDSCSSRGTVLGMVHFMRL